MFSHTPVGMRIPDSRPCLRPRRHCNRPVAKLICRWWWGGGERGGTVRLVLANCVRTFLTSWVQLQLETLVCDRMLYSGGSCYIQPSDAVPKKRGGCLSIVCLCSCGGYDKSYIQTSHHREVGWTCVFPAGISLLLAISEMQFSAVPALRVSARFVLLEQI
jgi:hypothetical protein